MKAPEKIGPYVLLERLGEGGMGTVYTAYHPQLNRRVALKLLRPGANANKSPAIAQARLLREAQAMAKLSHPNVVAVHDAGEYADQVYLVMERVEGVTLRQWLSDKPRSWKEVRGVFLQAGRGLAAAHAAGLVHRDFKPSNVLVGEDGRVRVTDFGLARALGVPESEGAAAGSPDEDTLENMGMLAAPLTREGAILGTPRYMAPEQFLGHSGDPLTDQFSFCVSLYEGLYGDKPFATRADPRAPPALREPLQPRRVPLYVHRAVLTGLSMDAQKRFASMDALLAALVKSPRRKYTVAAAVAGAALILAGAVLFGRGLRPHVPIGCEDVGHAFAESWGDTQRTALKAAFASTGETVAEANAAAAVNALDDYANAWTKEQGRACEKTVTARADETVFLELTCLSRQKQQFQALVDVLLHADKEIVGGGLTAVASLSPPADCANPNVLASLPKPPESAKTRSEVEALRVKMTRASALKSAGRPREAVALLLPLAQQAKDLSYRPLEAEVLYALGDAQEESEQVIAAEASLREAEKAAELAGMDLLAAEAAMDVAWTLAADLGRLSEAHAWAQRARAELERGGGSELLEAHLENVLYGISFAEGLDAEGLHHIERAVELRSRARGPTDLVTLEYRGNLAAQYAALCRNEEAVATQRKVVAELTTALGPQSSDVGIFLSHMGNSLRNLGRLDEADEALARALLIVSQSIGPQSPWVGEALDDQAWLRYDQGRFEDGLKLAQQTSDAVRRSVGKASSGYAAAMETQGVILAQLGRPAEAMTLLEQSVSILEKVESPTSPRLIDALLAAGSAQVDLKHPEKALPLLQRALDIMDQHCAQPGQRGWLQFALARALSTLHQQPERVAALAHQARTELAGLGWRKWQLDRVDAWMKQQRLK